ncbi:metal ABC transporter solute-binding protein, Zn/Mn family [Desulfosporosinus youngiae]|uniref:ABC-type metal ion transport system, periplasmic component/surface adhesin n=1 Tax=Desulfosporosinus youngiae DSM 17734 TaxID=768710 RepID=H5XXB5_9FIRM|nr:zinc ABC transporter substrate-binding protein [Desulfosporosinus youngiae]EHQ91121.1 ABC-type metal ion transport system, periplasmic component/surface adhesin [Desulfosporosinus youngiae DSM 17734]
MKRVMIILVTLMSCFLLMTGCSRTEKTEASDIKTTVAVTVLPQKALVEAVGGNLVEVIAIVPPGNSPGNYEPTPLEMEAFSKSAIYFTIGVPTEKANILPKAKDMIVVDLNTKVAEKYPDLEFSPGKRDPHIWLSPKRAKVMVETIAQEMSSLDVKNAEIYKQNAEEYLKKLDQLDRDIKAMVEGLNNKTFIVFHPAYGYLADDYGLTMYALEQSGKEATPQHLAEMIDLAKAENIKVIFSQAEIDSKQPQAFAEEIGGIKEMLNPLSADYITNLQTMAKAITGTMK